MVGFTRHNLHELSHTVSLGQHAPDLYLMHVNVTVSLLMQGINRISFGRFENQRRNATK